MDITNDQIVAEIPVNPLVLKWARDSRGLSPSDAASLLGLTASELAEYERGRKRPTLGLLRAISVKYRINYAALFMPEPLVEAIKPETDYRLHHQGVHALSLDTAVAIHDIRGILETLADLKEESPRLFHARALDSLLPRETPEALAIRQRAKFSVTRKEQLEEWKSDAVARERWRQEIESHGVFVYFRPLGIECSGLTIKHEGLFAVCINDKDTTNGRRIFTMLHEFCHVLRRQTGISDENSVNPVERYCNRFASAFLVPSASLVSIFGEPSEPRDFSMRQVSGLATRFKISISAMALRLETLGYGKPGLFDQIDRLIKARPKPEHDPNHKLKINRVSQQARRLGGRHAKITLAALDKGIINAADARGLLGLEPSSFAAFRAVVE